MIPDQSRFYRVIEYLFCYLSVDKSGRALAWDGGNNTEYPGMEERVVSFRMEGCLSEEPYAVMANGIRIKEGSHADHGISVVAMLGE